MAKTTIRGSITLSSKKCTVTVSSTAPLNPSEYTLWIDTTDNNILKRWEKGKWVNINDNKVVFDYFNEELSNNYYKKTETNSLLEQIVGDVHIKTDGSIGEGYKSISTRIEESNSSFKQTSDEIVASVKTLKSTVGGEVYTSTPTVPYSEKDIWVDTDSNNNVTIKMCKIARTKDEAFHTEDWQAIGDEKLDSYGMICTSAYSRVRQLSDEIDLLVSVDGKTSEITMTDKFINLISANINFDGVANFTNSVKNVVDSNYSLGMLDKITGTGTTTIDGDKIHSYAREENGGKIVHCYLESGSLRFESYGFGDRQFSFSIKSGLNMKWMSQKCGIKIEESHIGWSDGCYSLMASHLFTMGHYKTEGEKLARIGLLLGENYIALYNPENTYWKSIYQSNHEEYDYICDNIQYGERLFYVGDGFFECNLGSTFGDSLSVSGGTTLNSTLSVSGGTTLSSTLKVSGTTTLNSTLKVSKATTLSSTLTVSGTTTLSSTLSVSGGTTLSSTLTVSGNATYKGLVILKSDSSIFNIQINTRGMFCKNTGDDSISSNCRISYTASGVQILNRTGSIVGSFGYYNDYWSSKLQAEYIDATYDILCKRNLTVNGTTTLSSTLSVSGGTTLNSTLSVSGATTLNSTLTVSGNATYKGNINFSNSVYGNQITYYGMTFTNSNYYGNIKYTADGISLTNVGGDVVGSFGFYQDHWSSELKAEHINGKYENGCGSFKLKASTSDSSYMEFLMNTNYPHLQFKQYSNWLDIRPSSGDGVGLGTESLPFRSIRAKDVYNSSGIITSSDRKVKEDIKDIDDNFVNDLIDSLSAKTYKYIDGTSGRTHCGAIAQDVEKIITDMGLTTKDFAGIVKNYKTKEIENENEDGIFSCENDYEAEPNYYLRYEEFIMPLVRYCQLLKQRIEVLENTLNKNETSVTDETNVTDEVNTTNEINVVSE